MCNKSSVSEVALVNHNPCILRLSLLNRIEGMTYLSIYDNLAWVHRGQYLRWPSTFPSKQMRPLGRLYSSIRSKDGLSRFCRYGWQQIFCLGRRLDLLQLASKTPPCSLRFDHLLQDWCFRFNTDGVVWFTSKAGHVACGSTESLLSAHE